MKQILLLSKQDIDLSKEEVLSLAKNKKYILLDNLLIIDDTFKDYSRLAYTKSAYRLLFISNQKNLIKDIKKFSWNKIYKKSFCIRCINHPSEEFPERDIAAIIWNRLKQPNVDLENPKTEINFFFVKNKVIAGVLIKKNNQDFEERRAHLKPGFHPVSLAPRLARCMVNLTGAKKSDTIADLFCGVGGILVEAGLIGLKTVGNDINEEMLEKTKENLKFYNLRKYKLLNSDATKIKNKFDYIVSDLPYGINMQAGNLNLLYINFLKNLKKILKKKAVLGFPDSINYKKIIKNSKLKIEKEFTYYIHKNLSKKIIVIKK